jgi:hypothetical protein
MNILISIVSLLIFVLASVPVHASTLRVVTKENAIREYCKFFSPVKLKVRYNDRLDAISKEGDWFRVRFKGIKGCIHKTAVEEKTFTFSGILGSRTQAASSDEVALAGKGFNPEVENSFKSKYPELNFQTIDMIEKYKIPEDKLLRFIKSGGLNLPQ